VPVSELVELESLGPGHRPPTPAEIRGALPPGWVLEDDGVTARADLRVFFARSWILVLALVCFGTVGAGLLAWSLPAGPGGALRLAAMLGILVLAGGVAAPRITRALSRR
jgi:hypothetical protein